MRGGGGNSARVSHLRVVIATPRVGEKVTYSGSENSEARRLTEDLAAGMGANAEAVARRVAVRASFIV